LLCPFGYIDGVCHSQPIAAASAGAECSCPSDIFKCDPVKGCVCKQGYDCEAAGTHFVDFAKLNSNGGGESGGGGARAASLAAIILLLLLLVTILAVVYYRRRMQRMKKDLDHRSVRYIENSVLDRSKSHNPNEMVITAEPYPFELPPQQAPAAMVAASEGTTVGAMAMPNNTRSVAREKNVNLDRFKLGDDDGEHPSEVDGACAIAPGGTRI